jgi:hypothetical protein
VHTISMNVPNAEVASSNRTNFGFLMIQRAKPTRCLSPKFGLNIIGHPKSINQKDICILTS